MLPLLSYFSSSSHIVKDIKKIFFSSLYSCYIYKQENVPDPESGLGHIF